MCSARDNRTCVSLSQWIRHGGLDLVMTGQLQVEVLYALPLTTLCLVMTRFCTLCVLAALLALVACKVTDRRGKYCTVRSCSSDPRLC